MARHGARLDLGDGGDRALDRDGLTPAQRTFALTYLENGFNARRAYMTAHPAALESTAGLGAAPDRWQAHALALVSKPATRRLAFKACKGPGKTAVLAWIILWFLVCHFESKVGVTSITEANIDTNLWPELLKWMNRSEFMQASFVWTRSLVVKRGNENWFAAKRTWPKSGDADAQSNALAGLHADDVMFVLDESGGIPQGVMVTAEAVLSTFVPGSGHRAAVVQSGKRDLLSAYRLDDDLVRRELDERFGTEVLGLPRALYLRFDLGSGGQGRSKRWTNSATSVAGARLK